MERTGRGLGPGQGSAGHEHLEVTPETLVAIQRECRYFFAPAEPSALYPLLDFRFSSSLAVLMMP